MNANRLGVWDVLLIVVVAVQVLVLAYVFAPRRKAIIVALPIPFPFAVMAVGLPVDASNVLGVMLLYVFAQSVRMLHYTVRLPIVAAIVAATIVYSASSTLLLRVVPATPISFWGTSTVAFVFALGTVYFRTPRDEPGHVSPLPLYVKTPLIIAIVASLVLSKEYLQGFMTTFPMVALLGSYEARKSLCTFADQIPYLILIMLPLMVASHLTWSVVGLGWSLVLGWGLAAIVVYLTSARAWQLMQNAEGRAFR